MRFGKEFENKPIISVSNGQILGRTKDVYLDSQLERLAGIFVGTEGVIRRKERIIPDDRIVLFGVDVILVQDPDVITTTKALPETGEWHRLSDLQGKQVHTPGGTKLATIDDIVIDDQGQVSGFSLSRVYISGPLADKPFIPRDVVVDPLQSGEVLIVDFPKLEAEFAETEAKEETADTGQEANAAGDTDAAADVDTDVS